MLPLAAAMALLLGFVPEEASPTRLVRSTSGSRGSVQGARYVIDDPRAAFTAGTDRQIVVLFEWETLPGRHHCEASWRDPSGKVVLISPADFDARGRKFSAYWSLSLPDSPTLGLWAVEAKLDGQPAGIHTFQLSEQPRDPDAVVRKVQAPKDLYARAAASTVVVEARGPQGELLQSGSGFYVDDQHLVTAFQVIEGASSLRATLPAGRQVDASAIAQAHRRQDWAVLRTEPSGVPPLSLAQKGAVSVGDHGVFLDVSADGSRTLQEVSVVGRREVPVAGPRLNLSAGATFAALGSPLLNDYGEVVGIMGGSLEPGSSLSRSGGMQVAWGTIAVAPLAIPSELIPASGALKAETFHVGELLTRGVSAPPLSRARSVLYGLVGRGDVSLAAGLRGESQLSRHDGAATVQITWDSTLKQEGEARFGVFDADNRPVAMSEPAKVKVRTGQLAVSSWKFPLARLTPGVYRIDVTFAGAVVWRDFLTLTD